MRTRLFALVGLAGLTWLLMAATMPPKPAATAQSDLPACALRAELVALLARRYGESLIWRGQADLGVTVEVLASDLPTGSWSILVTNSAGNACLVASGQGWHALPAQREGKDA